MALQTTNTGLSLQGVRQILDREEEDSAITKSLDMTDVLFDLGLPNNKVMRLLFTLR
jgi:hypothetical protein